MPFPPETLTQSRRVTPAADQAGYQLPTSTVSGTVEATGASSAALAKDSSVDGLEALITSTNTKLDALATAIASTNTKLDTIITELGTANTHLDAIETNTDRIP